MIQKTAYILFTFLLLFTKVSSQKVPTRTICCCSTIIEQLSDGWKKDSLANNDYRFTNVKFLKTCVLDTISITYLLEKFGPASRINKTNHGSEYVYYFYDIRTKPKGYDGPLAAAGIIFHFKNNEKNLSNISETDIDL